MKQEDLLLKIQEIINDIEENLSSPLSVKDYAAKSGYSIWQFQRIFRSMVGDSLGNYLRGRRLTKAADRLLNSEDKIIDIALEFQFGSQEAFSRAFKNQFGRTPKQVRTEKRGVKVSQKPKLSLESIKHFNGGIVQEPEIVELPERKFVGLEIKMPSHLIYAESNIPLLVSTWIKFNPMKTEIQSRIGKTSFGIATSEGKENEENELGYITAVEVEKFEDVPEGLSAYTMSAGTFAVFENVGLGDKTVHTISYIYGTWLPQSEYKRAKGDDFELFDQRFDMYDENSVSQYFIPIEKL